MGKIHKGQTAISLTLDSYIDLSAATSTRIYYKKPSGTTGYWSATVVNTTRLRYSDFETTTLDEEGPWYVWVYAVITAGIAIGEAVRLDVYEAGKCLI